MALRPTVSSIFAFWSLTGLYFLCQIAHAQQATLTRGPYLQLVTPTSITIRWRTLSPTASQINYGTDPGQLTQQARDTAQTTEHIVQLTNLKPATRYFYSVGNSQASSNQYFTTAPPVGSTAPVRIWALGDFGRGDINQQNVRDQSYLAMAKQAADIWIWLGDNAYCCGRDAEYQQNVFDVYSGPLPRLPFWPSPGNHEYADNPYNFNIPYYSLITVPQKAEAGGVASNSKAYYSFDYGQIHFVSLDSYGFEDGRFRLADSSSRQMQWLKRDLSANRQPWTIVFFHHPPYAKGSKDSDTDPELIAIRQKVTPILEQYKVDLVLSGHSHTYERSYLLNGYTGTSAQFNTTQHTVSNTSGRYDNSPNSCPLIQKGKGTVYVVNGSGGQIGGKASGWPHQAMVYSNNEMAGSMLIDVLENRLDARFVCADGTVRDQFTIMKAVNQLKTNTIQYGETVKLTASWPTLNNTGYYRWSEGEAQARSIEITPQKSGRFTVSDEQNCLQDIFDITVLMPTGLEPHPDNTLKIYPNPATDRLTIEVTLPVSASLEWHLLDQQGRCLSERTLSKSTRFLEPISLPAGQKAFFLNIKIGDKSYTRKVIRQ